MLFRRKKDKDSDKKSSKKDKSKLNTTDAAPNGAPAPVSELDVVFDRCVASANLISQILKQVQKECDIEEFVYNIDWVSSGLARIRSAASSAPQLEAQLTQFAIQLEAYHRNLQHHGKKLVDVFSSARRRPALAQHNSRMYNELKFILDSMAQAGKLSDTASPGGTTATRKRSQGQLTSQEAQMFWNKHFLDLELEMVPWDRFVAGFATATGVKLELHEELLLKHVLDNDNLGAVTPKELNSFLRAFGPVERALQNVKDIYSQKWFHHFLSVDEVIRSLSDQPPGTFLVRFSRSKSDAFALEYVESKGKVRTVLIKNNMPHGVSIAEEHNVEKTFGSIHQLIQHYSDTLKFPFHSDLLHRNWFFGDTSSEEAEEMLFGRPAGTFMIHFADTGRFQYVASYVSSKKDSTAVKRVQIIKVPSGYQISLNNQPESASSSSAPKSKADDNDFSEFAGVVFPSLPKLITACRRILRFNYDPDNVPRVRLAPFNATSSLDMEGPGTSDGTGVKLSIGSQAAGSTVASYPKGSLGWQIVCDQFEVKILGNRVLFVVCDGCGWGLKSREAAMRAAKEIIVQMSDPVVQSKLDDTLECKHFLLRSFSLAHEAILLGKEDIWLAGTTTVLAGMLVQMHPNACSDPSIPEWALITASVGDCKCFVWNTTSKSGVDITYGNRSNLRDASDPGGRIGPFIEPHGHPDLRNLAAYFWPLKSDDTVIVASDGVHDNLEPECVALSPSEAMSRLSPIMLRRFRLPEKLPSLSAPPSPGGSFSFKSSWDQLGSIDNKFVERLKSAFMAQRLHELIAALEQPSLAQICDTLIQNSFDTTLPSRNFMEQNPDKSEPKDRLKFPGKMDHCTAVALSSPSTWFSSTTIEPLSSSSVSIVPSSDTPGKKKSPHSDSTSSLRAEAEQLNAPKSNSSNRDL